ncbi:MAG: hypothetical protein ACLP9L_03365 [Thermoguttaceae bacterium]
MSLTETMIEGTIQPDGTLLLDEKPNLSPGRVTVVLRQETAIVIPSDDPFWQRMQAMWDAQDAAGRLPRSVEQIETERREMRLGWAGRQDALERIQEESRRACRSAGEATP